MTLELYHYVAIRANDAEIDSSLIDINNNTDYSIMRKNEDVEKKIEQ